MPESTEKKKDNKLLYLIILLLLLLLIGAAWFLFFQPKPTVEPTPTQPTVVTPDPSSEVPQETDLGTKGIGDTVTIKDITVTLTGVYILSENTWYTNNRLNYGDKYYFEFKYENKTGKRISGLNAKWRLYQGDDDVQGGVVENLATQLDPGKNDTGYFTTQVRPDSPFDTLRMIETRGDSVTGTTQDFTVNWKIDASKIQAAMCYNRVDCKDPTKPVCTNHQCVGA